MTRRLEALRLGFESRLAEWQAQALARRAAQPQVGAGWVGSPRNRVNGVSAHLLELG